VGVGPLVGLSLTNTLERVPFRNADAFVAFTGLDPRAKDSGQKSGRRRLSKRGPAELRRLLFNAAMAAVRTKVWKPIYDAYRTQGWSGTATLVIIARKIARAAWSIHRYQTIFNPDRLTKGLT
jgi:transposase